MASKSLIEVGMEKSLGKGLMEDGKLQRAEGELVLEIEDKVVSERS